MTERGTAAQLVTAIRHAPRALRRLDPTELLLLAQAPIALPLVALALRRTGLQRVQRFLGRREPRDRRGEPAERRIAMARRLAWVVYAGAAYGPWPANCLQRSVVLWWFLRRRDLDGEIRIGVRRDRETRTLAFHAWVEYEGLVLNDDPAVREMYTVFDRPIAPRTASFD